MMEITLDQLQEVMSHLYLPETLGQYQPWDEYRATFRSRAKTLSHAGAAPRNEAYQFIRFVRTPYGWSLESDLKIVSGIHP